MAEVMCIEYKCPRRETCYKYRALPSRWQSMFAARVFSMTSGCKYYQAIVAGDPLQPLEICDKIAKNPWDEHLEQQTKEARG